MIKNLGFIVVLIVATFLNSVDARAQATVGRLSIDTTPKSDIFLDGAPMGKAPLHSLKVTPGSHHVMYQNKKMGQQFEVDIRVQAGKHMKCSYSFESSEHRCKEEKTKGTVQAVSNETVDLISNQSAEVFMDGRLIGKTNIPNYVVAPGSYEFEFKADGFPAVTKKVDVQAGQHLKVEVNFEAPEKKD